MARLSGGGGGAGGMGAMLGGGRKAVLTERTLKIKDARVALEDAEVERRLASVDLRREAVTLAEQNGIVFIDEIDKLISNRSKHSGDASSEGVQRDLLPLIEGTVIEVRRFGNVRTDYMLFVASGAFHEHKPSELLAELQGRLPIRVELKGLDAKDLERILTETKFNMLEQQKALMLAEGVRLEFEPDAVLEIARLAAEVNRSVENIGARRLHTVIERCMEDISFGANELVAEARARGEEHAKVVVDRELVRRKLMPMLERSDFSRFIL
jgi:ATP-dependent HslUV protease ATP-binding subunit HslU